MNAALARIIEDAPVKGGEAFRKLNTVFPPRPITDKTTFATYSALVHELTGVIGRMEIHGQDLEDAKLYLPPVIHFIAEYEATAYPTKTAAPEEILKFLMDRHNLNQTDLKSIFGTQSIVSEILNGKRQMNRQQIERMAAYFNLNPWALMAPNPNKLVVVEAKRQKKRAD